MRLIVRVVCLALFVATAAFAGLPYRDEVVAYTSDQRAFTKDQVRPLFDSLLAQAKPVIVFVHGRGDEPKKSLEGTRFFLRLAGVDGHAVAKLEQYGANVVLVSWDSRHGEGVDDRCLPLSMTPRGAEKLEVVLHALADALDARAAKGQTSPQVTLLAHSMGNIVLQRYVEAKGWKPRGQQALFTNVVLSSSDADNTGHAEWVEKIATIEHVFVTVNAEDGILQQSKQARPKQGCSPATAQPLGLEPGAPLAKDATYVRIDHTKAHEIFTQKDSRPEVTRFFAAAFKGAPIQSDGAAPGPVTLK